MYQCVRPQKSIFTLQTTVSPVWSVTIIKKQKLHKKMNGGECCLLILSNQQAQLWPEFSGGNEGDYVGGQSVVTYMNIHVNISLHTEVCHQSIKTLIYVLACIDLCTHVFIIYLWTLKINSCILVLLYVNFSFLFGATPTSQSTTVNWFPSVG